MHSTSSQPFRVALLLGSQGEYERAVTRGIARYARPNRNWVFLSLDPHQESLGALDAFAPHGVIGSLYDRPFGAAVRQRSAKLVNVSFLPPCPELSAVRSDDLAVGRMAGEYFLARGFRHFGFSGLPEAFFSNLRRDGFVAAVRRAGHSCAIHETPSALIAGVQESWMPDDRETAAWLASLPKPVAVLACNDGHGWKLAEACRRAGIEVPGQVAIVGVDNDPQWCALAYPPLSSVALPAEQIGYESAAVLDRLLRGGRLPRRPRLIPPEGVITRRTSDTLAVSDPGVAAALRRIRLHAADPGTLKGILADPGMSRRALERRFRQELGTTPLQELHRARIELVKHWLATTDLPMPQVARRSGLSGGKHLAELFHRITGQTPTNFRRRFRTHG